ncbi:hypothetical protein P9112_007632 [Eukaryota sp. TZLM1-RC]
MWFKLQLPRIKLRDCSMVFNLCGMKTRTELPTIAFALILFFVEYRCMHCTHINLFWIN